MAGFGPPQPAAGRCRKGCLPMPRPRRDVPSPVPPVFGSPRFVDLTAELQAELMCDALERLGVCAMVVDAAGKVLFATPGAAIRPGARVEACSDLMRGHGPSTPRTTTLVTQHEITNMMEGIGRAAVGPRTTEQRVALIDRDDDRTLLQAYVVPLDGRHLPRAWALGATKHPVVILLFARSQLNRRTRLHALRARYGLTRTETAVALQIAEGHGRSAAAVTLGISLATVRTHLSHIFEKTGVRRQAELVRLVLKSLD